MTIVKRSLEKMKISYIITINPVIPIDYLNVLINSLNLQSCKEFDVIFYKTVNCKYNSSVSHIPSAFIFPATSSFSSGVEVPMPISPFLLMMNLY